MAQLLISLLKLKRSHGLKKDSLMDAILRMVEDLAKPSGNAADPRPVTQYIRNNLVDNAGLYVQLDWDEAVELLVNSLMRYSSPLTEVQSG